MTASKGVDPRVERTRSVVLEATRQLLTEVGVDRTCIELVAERSGVARSTIYRHWENTPVLVMDALSGLAASPEAPSSGDDEADLRAVLLELAEVLRSPMSNVMVDLMAAASRDPELARLHRAYIERKRARALEVIARLQASGRIDPALDPAYVADLGASPLLYRRFNLGDPMDDGQVGRHVGELLARLAPPTG